MRKIARYFSLSFLLVLPFFFVVGQDIEFTQFQNTPMYYNPAQAGAKEGIRTFTLGRFQWLNLPVSYYSFHFEGDFGMRSIPGIGGFGLIVSANRDGIGFIKDFQVGASLSSRINISDKLAVQIGLKGSVNKRKVNWDEFIWPDTGSDFQPPPG